MTPELFWIPGPWPGSLAVLARPRGADWLEDEARGWKDASLDLVISLLEKDEASELGLEHEGDVARSHRIDFASFPIPDRGIPASRQEALLLLKSIGAALDKGKKVAVHCRQGIGRSGLITVGMLVATGTGLDKAIDAVSAARGEPVPETREQLHWLRRLASEFLVAAS